MLLLPNTRIPLFTVPRFLPIRSNSKPFTTDNSTQLALKPYSNSLQSCTRSSDLLHAKSIHAHLLKTSLLPSSVFLQNHLLTAYLNCKHPQDALHLFDEMPFTNTVSWTSLISGFVHNCLPSQSLLSFSRMRLAGVTPNEFTFVAALRACCSLPRSVSLAYQLYGLVIRSGFESNVFIFNVLLSSLIRNEECGEAFQAFEAGHPLKDMITWNTMLDGFSRLGPSKLPSFFSTMIGIHGVKPDAFSFSSVFAGLAEIACLEMGMQVQGLVVKAGHGNETGVGNSLVSLYLKSGNLTDGFKAFDEMVYKNEVSWTSMASGCCSCGEPGKALDIIGEMRKTRMPNKFVLSTMLNASARIPSLGEGRKAHSLRIKLGRRNEDYLEADNALLDMYMKCGSMDEALAVFARMKNRSIVSWTAMVMGFAYNGESKQALRVFDEMLLEGMKPNYVTFVGVLSACSQGGLVEEGRKYFSEMTRVYGIEPGEDHYMCMVDLLGRTGNVEEAERLIVEMEAQPGRGSPLGWKTLLGACCNHGDFEMGKRAAEQALSLSKHDGSTYVLLSNMFASSSRWDRVEALRKVMESRNLDKMSGCSRFEG